jgi:hypothetical protein
VERRDWPAARTQASILEKAIDRNIKLLRELAEQARKTGSASATASKDAARQRPEIELVATGKEAIGNAGVRYHMKVNNFQEFEDVYFRPGKSNKDCGEKQSRLEGKIYSTEQKVLAEFCGFKASEDLSELSFGLPQGDSPPNGVYLLLEDSETGESFKSNTLSISEFK